MPEFFDKTHGAWEFPKDSVVTPIKGKDKGLRAVVEAPTSKGAQIRFDDGRAKTSKYTTLRPVKKAPVTFTEAQFTKEYLTNFQTFKELSSIKKPWEHGYYFTKNSYGTCYCSQKFIAFNLPYIQQGKRDSILDTVLHEIAHALAGCNAGHGSVWQAMAKKIGCTGKPCKDAETSGVDLQQTTGAQAKKSILICSDCGSTAENYSCNECGGRSILYSINKYGAGAFESGKKIGLAKNQLDQIVSDYAKLSKFIANSESAYIRRNSNIQSIGNYVERLQSTFNNANLAREGTVLTHLDELTSFVRKVMNSFLKRSNFKTMPDGVDYVSLLESFLVTITGKTPTARKKSPPKLNPIARDSKYKYVCMNCGSGEAGYKRRITVQPVCPDCNKEMTYMYSYIRSGYVLQDEPFLSSSDMADLDKVTSILGKWPESTKIGANHDDIKSKLERLKRFYNSNLMRRYQFVWDNISGLDYGVIRYYDSWIKTDEFDNMNFDTVPKEDVIWAIDRYRELHKQVNIRN